MSDVELKTVAASDKSRAIELLKQGFEKEPTYRWCLCADEVPDYEQRLALCMKADYEYHEQFGLIYGAYINNKLMGVVYVQPPNMSEIGASFPWMDILAQCGAETLKRVECYMEEIVSIKWATTYYKISFVAVDESCRGQKIGTQLLAWVDELSQADATSQGLQLETSSSDNVRLYERNGYRLMQEKNFYGIQQYLMFKARV